MLKSRLIEQICDRETDKHAIAEKVIDEPGLLPELYQGLDAKEARIKYGCAKVLRIVSDARPELIYPRFDFFAELLDTLANKTNSSNHSQNPHDSAGGRVSRRSLLAAGLAAPIIVPRFVLGGPANQAPSDKLQIAAVGVGGMGQSYPAECRNENIVALCDLDHNLAGKVFKRFPGATTYHDYRKMFEKEADNFDALIIATPDHTHAVLLTEAIRLNKHMYRCNDHYGEWIKACKTSSRTVCPIEFGCKMTEMALLGALALRTKRVLAWDAKAMKVTNHANANKYVDPPYRDGWTL